eukprot:g14254.t1
MPDGNGTKDKKSSSTNVVRRLLKVGIKPDPEPLRYTTEKGGVATKCEITRSGRHKLGNLFALVLSFLTIKDLCCYSARMKSQAWTDATRTAIRNYVHNLVLGQFWCTLGKPDVEHEGDREKEPTKQKPKQKASIQLVANAVHRVSLSYCVGTTPDLLFNILSQINQKETEQRSLERVIQYEDDLAAEATAAAAVTTTTSATQPEGGDNKEAVQNTTLQPGTEGVMEGKEAGKATVKRRKRFEYVARRYQHKIDEVDLYYCLRITDSCVSKLVRTIPGLKRLNLGRCNITNKIFEATKHKRGPLFKLKQLEYLSLRNCHGLYASDLEALVEMTSLKELDVEGCGFGEQELADLRNVFREKKKDFRIIPLSADEAGSSLAEKKS